LLGADGLRRSAAASHANTQALAEKACTIPGVRRLFGAPHFHEVVLHLPGSSAKVLAGMAAQGVLGGYGLSTHYPQLGNAILVCATETKTAADLQRYVDTLRLSLN
jgi:glycine dehydrogenase subunit 1